MSTFTLEELFRHADIDDLTEEDEYTELVFTMRGSRGEGVNRIAGYNLDDVLDQARLAVNRYLTLEGLRREGLTDADIDRLADDRAEIWERGYIAGATDSAQVIAEQALRAPAQSAPVMAAAGEPIASSLDNIISKPGAVDDLINGDGIGIELALIMPARIVRA